VIKAASAAHHATVNDLVLTAVGGALGKLLADRGDEIDHLVVSVLFSSRRDADQCARTRAAAPARGAPDRLDRATWCRDGKRHGGVRDPLLRRRRW